MKSWSGVLLVAAQLVVSATFCRADNQVVTDYGDNGGSEQLRAKLQAVEDTGGGSLTFAGNPTTIVLAQGALPAITNDTTIEGGGNLSISGNNASRIFFVAGGATLTLNDITLTNGYSSSDDGGAIRNDGSLVVNNCHITNNRADGWSGGAIASYAPLTITNCEFASNKAANGGALFPRYGPAVVTISGSSFHDNSTDDVENAGGGAIFVFDGAPVTLTDSDLTNNSAYNGGAIHTSFANNSVTLQRTTLQGNHASNRGGGVYLQLGSVTMTDVTVSGNQANKPFAQIIPAGGGLYAESAVVTLTNVTLASNAASDGGGLCHVNGQATLTNVTFSNNSAFRGAGLFNEDATATLMNATFYGNKSSGARINGNGGGGIFNLKFMGTPHLSLTNVVLQNNTEANGAAGNCTFPQNAPPDSSSFNLSSDNTCNFGAGDNTDPQLRVLADYGGFTLTHAPEPSSPVIDAGTGNGAPATDQRGVKRPQGKAVDIGAVELENNQLPGCKDVNTVVMNNDDAGDGSLRDVITNACAGSTITFASGVTGAITLTSGQLSLNTNVTIAGPGADVLTVQRSASAGNFRIFNVPSSQITAGISGLTIANGAVGAAEFGAGISNAGNLTLDRIAVLENTAGIGGGGIYNDFGASIAITNSTIAGNISASGAGGALNNGTLNIVNSTISGNQANSGNGGGIVGGIVVLTNSTIAKNSASGSGGGVFQNGNNGGSVTARNTLIALNTAPADPDFSGPLTSHGFNLIGDSSGATITPQQATDVIAVPAEQLKLGPLQNNGGPTSTHALLSGSLAIDRGNSSGSTTDQRGLSRPVDLPGISNAEEGDGSDIGAFEAQSVAATSQLGNISTRLSVQGGDNVLIGGFIVTGAQNKKVLIRAIGPSLPVDGKLADPLLELHDSAGTLIVSNNNWKDSQQAEIEATGVPPSNELEAAIVATLPANSARYTAVVRGADGGSGVGLVEVYDLDRSVDSKLANISTRGLVQTGDNVMIGGFIVLGDNPQQVIVRAIGPSLPVEGKLENPFLELHDKQGMLLQSNDDWRTDQEAEIQATGVAPSNDLESAIVRTVPPGNYTAVVRGTNDTPGIALVEVFAP